MISILQVMRRAKALAAEDGRDWESLRGDVLDQYVDIARDELISERSSPPSLSDPKETK